jgi:hypothetical protein
MGKRKDINAADRPLDLGAAPPGAYGRPQPAAPHSPTSPPGEEVEDMGALNPVFAWFEGGDVIQFGNLCPSCPPDVKNDCRLWRLDTLDGVAAREPRLARDCLFFIKWNNDDLTVHNITGEEKEEGKTDISHCPSCGQDSLATASRTSSEFGTRMNPRMVTFHWCGCGHFSAEKKDLKGDREHCVFCGRRPTKDDRTVFGGAHYHIDCFLRLRFFFTMGEMLKVAQGYAVTGKTLGLADSETALRKTLHISRAFRVSGNGQILGVNRVIHWLQGESPIVTDRKVLRSRQELQKYLGSIFEGGKEHSVGVHILEDAYIVYNNASDVRWITHGAYSPVHGVCEFLETYIDPAARGDWASIDKHLLNDVPDGKCVCCGALTRSHRVAAGENDQNVYVCHHCWTRKLPPNDMA